MKTKTIFLLALIAFTYRLHAQEKSTASPIRVVGIGIKTMNLLNDLTLSNYVMPGNRIVLTINATPHFRLQPEFGTFSTKEHNDLVDKDLKGSNTTFGIGVYGMIPKDRTNLYGGLKYSSTKDKQDDVDQYYNPNPPYNPITSVVTYETTNTAFGLVIGGEYLLSNHFSVGTEVGFSSIKTKMSDGSSSEDEESSSFMTETNLLMRFYF